ncbi:zinc finger C3HC4 type domain containing protein [Nitzschia inconspicua]|uniref:Zinc finger C3HC4 type domain containing protein n=1 Tax=Nitzschia inconspicua TaxID=303405 RepID=A0A9K3L660_9STRA|nr:zinc finger C3HC4 type domain containing protein [Nitzschia inconspicua]
MVASSFSNEWVAFNDEGTSSGFEAIVAPSATLARRSSRSKVGETSGMHHQDRGHHDLDNSTVATWMKQPINSDASWAPVAPPESRTLPREEHPTANKKRPPKNREIGTSSAMDPPDGSMNFHGPNPVSSDSSESSGDKRKKLKNKSRPKSIERTQSTKSARSSSRAPATVSRSASSQRKQSTNITNEASIENNSNAVRDAFRGDLSSSSTSHRVRSSSKPRGNSTERSLPSKQVASAPAERNISSSSEQTSSSVNERPGESSNRESRQSRDVSDRRGRSRTRTTESQATVGIPSQHSFRSQDVVPVLQPPPSTGRGRSSSRARSTVRERSCSTTRRNSVNHQTTTQGKQRSGSRPPATSASRRPRSTSRTPVTRSRSVSRTRTMKPPPSTSRTRREMRTTVGCSNSVSGGSIKRTNGANRSSINDDNSFRSVDPNIGRDISFGRTQSSALKPLTPKRSVFMEKLFGDQVTDEAKQAYLPRADVTSPLNGSVSSVVSWQQPERIHSRILLTATVYHNTATNLWIATINTNQKGVAKNPATASKYLKAFSFSSENEARESAIANAPPKMMKFEDNPNCFICRGKFAMFRRACHCRNCGVCVCNACATTWPSRMIPETYNLKKESTVKICKTCNFLSGAFKKALLDGDYEEAIALYGSGNINLRTPFPQLSKKKEEMMYPIHCAVEGGNIDIVRWLMEDHFCPVKVIRTASGKKTRKGGSPDFPILTSKNRSVLSIAMESLHVEILRYLVVDNTVSIYESKDLKASLRALEAVLLALPAGYKDYRHSDDFVHRWDDAVYDGEISVNSSICLDYAGGDEDVPLKSKRHSSDSCIICYENAIDCVITPCGHQICCLECSKNLSACPVCNMQGDFIKIFRP